MFRSLRIVLGILAAGATVMAEVGSDPSQNIAWWFDQSGWHYAAQWIKQHGPSLIGPLVIPLLSFICVICFLWQPLFWFYRKLSARALPSLELVPDMPIHAVIDYIVNDSLANLKKSPPPEVRDYGPAAGQIVQQAGVEHQDALDRLYEKLISGKISAWGYREITPPEFFPAFEAVIRPIPGEYWGKARPHPLFSFGADNTVAHTAFPSRGSAELPNYTNLQFSKSEVTKIWPRKPWAARLVGRLSKAKRITYWRPFDV